MATVTSPPKPPVNRTDTDRRVRHPLQKLRGYIRTYVTLEGVAVALLFLALWFWIGLFLDYGSFRLFALDWTYELTEATSAGTATVLRVFVLVVLVGGLLALVGYKIFLRLFREFRDAALALVLERRFPKQLGDRLITAVEMADPKVAQKYGFSQSMIDQTINEAADRVEKVPVGDVFNWGRLVWHGVFVVLCTLVLYLVLMASVCVVEGTPVNHYFVRFNHTAAIWAERNLLLMDTAWPRSAHLELVRLQTNKDGEIRAPRDYSGGEDRPDVLIRALQYVVADRDAPLGWRALTYKDLQERQLVDAGLLDIKLPRDWDSWYVDLDDLPARVPNGLIPAEWKWQGKTSGRLRAELHKPAVVELLKSKRGQDVRLRAALTDLLDWHHWTLDKIELQIDKPEVKAALIDEHEPAYRQFKALIQAVKDAADDPGMERTLRHLTIPETVTIIARGKSGKSSTPKDLEEFNKYTYSLNKLPESSRLSVNARDFYSPATNVVLLEPPSLDLIVADKQEPAYLYYRYLKNAQHLKDKRQMLRGTSVSKGGTESTINLASGATVTIRGTASRELREGVRIIQPDKTEGAVLRPIPPVYLLADRRTFEAKIERVTQRTELDFVFRDLDGVKGVRRFILVPFDDTPALVTDVSLPARFRVDPKDRNRRVVTPSAVIAWKGKVNDDRSLTRLAWRYEYEERDVELFRSDKQTIEEETPENRKLKAFARVAAHLAFPPSTTQPAFSEAALLLYFGGKRAVRHDSGYQDFAVFKSRAHREPQEDVTAEELDLLLQVNPQHRPHLNELLGVNVSAADLRDLARRYQEAEGDGAKLSGLNTPQQSVRRVLDAVRAGSVDELQAADKLRSFTRDVLAALKLSDDYRAAQAFMMSRNPALSLALRLSDDYRAAQDKRLRGEPVAVLADLLALINDRADEKALLSEALQKHPDRQLVKQWDLENEVDFDLDQFKLKAAKDQAQPHYELKLFVHARDSNVERVGPLPPDVGPFTFLVVSQIDLDDLMTLQKGPMQALLRKTVENLETRKTGLDSEVTALKATRPNVAATVQRLDQTLATVRESGDIARGILFECQGILEEMELNRFTTERVKEEEDKIVNPLASICEPDLTKKLGSELLKTDRDLERLKTNLDKIVTKVGADEGALWDEEIGKNLPIFQQLTSDSAAQVEDLSKKLRKVLEALTDLQSTRDQRARLVYILAHHRQNTLYLKQLKVRRDKADWDAISAMP